MVAVHQLARVLRMDVRVYQINDDRKRELGLSKRFGYFREGCATDDKCEETKRTHFECESLATIEIARAVK